MARLTVVTIPAAEEEAFKRALEIIKERYGLSGNAAAIRFAVYKLAGMKVRLLDGMSGKIVEVR